MDLELEFYNFIFNYNYIEISTNDIIKLGISGTRCGLSDEARLQFHTFLQNNYNKCFAEVRHGDCKGVDEDIHKICEKKYLNIIIHPPKANSYRAFCNGNTVLEQKDFITRNHDIVDNSSILVAFPETKEEQLRSGTWSTIRYARNKILPIMIIFRDGSIEKNMKSIFF